MQVFVAMLDRDAPSHVVHNAHLLDVSNMEQRAADAVGTAKCVRCKEPFGTDDTCQDCGVHRSRVVKRIRRRNIGGKYGRNSGKVTSSKNKS